MVQKSRQLELPFEPRGGAPKAERSGQASTATSGNERSGTSTLLVEALQRENLARALKRVRKNRGSPGIDGMTVDELPEWLREHWPGVREQLLAGTYQPAPVRQVVIPKPGGGERDARPPRPDCSSVTLRRQRPSRARPDDDPTEAGRRVRSTPHKRPRRRSCQTEIAPHPSSPMHPRPPGENKGTGMAGSQSRH